MFILKQEIVEAGWWLKELRNKICCVPNCLNKSEVHHLLKMRERDDYGVNLCKYHHTFSNDSIHILGDIDFMKVHNFNIYEYLLTVLLPEFRLLSLNRGFNEK